MGISKVDRRVAEFSALIKRQLRLIRRLEKGGKDDLASATIVLDSLGVSFFLATQEWQRAHCCKVTDATEMNERFDSLLIVTKTNEERQNGQLAVDEKFKFRPLAEEEKKEFVNSLDAKSKGTLAKLESEKFEFVQSIRPVDPAGY